MVFYLGLSQDPMSEPEQQGDNASSSKTGNKNSQRRKEQNRRAQTKSRALSKMDS